MLLARDAFLAPQFMGVNHNYTLVRCLEVEMPSRVRLLFEPRAGLSVGGICENQTCETLCAEPRD
jgi:hypothetical protein